jgi:hypothetical protein
MGSKKKTRPRAKEKACDRAIQRTLAYSSIFNYPMSEHQLYTFLITKKDFEYDFFKKSLRRLVKGDNVKAKNGKYYSPGIRPVSWKLRRKYSQDLIKESQKAIKYLSKIPWIKMIGITGAVATHNASKDDDIDIFIITEKNRLWISRFFVFLILKAINKYGHGKKDARKFCCNLWCDESAMKWGKAKQNIYVARELLNVLPIYDKDDTYLKFLNENDWVFKHYNNFKIQLPKKYSKRTFNNSKVINSLENFLRKLQLDYMKSKKTTEITTKNFIHFNKHDHSKEILSNYKELLEKL